MTWNRNALRSWWVKSLNLSNFQRIKRQNYLRFKRNNQVCHLRWFLKSKSKFSMLFIKQSQVMTKCNQNKESKVIENCLQSINKISLLIIRQFRITIVSRKNNRFWPQTDHLICKFSSLIKMLTSTNCSKMD